MQLEEARKMFRIPAVACDRVKIMEIGGEDPDARHGYCAGGILYAPVYGYHGAHAVRTVVFEHNGELRWAQYTPWGAEGGGIGRGEVASEGTLHLIFGRRDCPSGDRSRWVVDTPEPPLDAPVGCERVWHFYRRHDGGWDALATDRVVPCH